MSFRMPKLTECKLCKSVWMYCRSTGGQEMGEDEDEEEEEEDEEVSLPRVRYRQA